jgi:flagellar biosynthesis/type III secretory pathway M-ring protein FliF/YscJ
MKENIKYSLFFSGILSGLTVLALEMQLGFSKIEAWWIIALFLVFFLISFCLMGTLTRRIHRQLRKMDEELEEETEEKEEL